MKARVFFILTLSLLLLSGCSKQHQSKILIRDFLNENLVYGDIGDDSYGKLDSTSLVTKDRIEKMHEITRQMPEFHHNIQYGTPTSKLMFVTVKYQITRNDGKVMKYRQTFYMNKNLKEIVAFKDN